MDLSQALNEVKQLISQGELEVAYEQLGKLLDTYAHYAELADMVRINQADLYQLKAQTIKGTIAPEDARIASNQLADNALQIIRQLETGKVGLADSLKPGAPNAWRYYLIGGLVTVAVAAIIWLVFFRQQDCPAFSDSAELRVMILPFKQTGKTKEVQPEFDIMDGLNDLIDKTPGLRVRAIADVNKNFDIENDYPNPAQAIDITRHCDAQMLVWGKVNQSSGKDYTVDVRYRLLDAGGVRSAGDTVISRLLTVTEEGSWTRDVGAITRLLYMVLANQMQVPIAANILPTPPTAVRTDSIALADTSTNLVLADYYIQKNEVDSAIVQFDHVLEVDPGNQTALTKRGALLMEKKEYSSAARDLEAAKSTSKATATALNKVRIEAFLKSGQPEKAEREVQSVSTKENLDGAWLQEKTREVHDSTIALQERRDQMERLAVARPRDAAAQLDAAKANLGLGETDKAIKLSQEVLKRDPKNLDAVRMTIEAHLQRGDTANARKTFESAERAGAKVQDIKTITPVSRPFVLKRKQ